MNSLSLCEVTRENWRSTLALAVWPEQQQFVADYSPIAALALAKAYVRPGGLIWIPYLFLAGSEPVGFVVLAYEPESLDNYWIFHFFIDRRYQGRGYGREALALFLRFIRKQYPQCRTLNLTVHPENELARRLYTGVGFQATHECLDDEPVYRLSMKEASRPGEPAC